MLNQERNCQNTAIKERRWKLRERRNCKLMKMIGGEEMESKISKEDTENRV